MKRRHIERDLAVAGLDAAPGPSWREVASLAELALIFEAGVNLVYLPRRLSPCIQRYAEELSRSDPFATQLVARTNASSLGGLLPASADFRRELLRRDVGRLAELYADLTGAKEIGLRFRNLTNAMCPRFHTDRVGIRLICAYAGAGTEWLADEDADRSALGGSLSAGQPDPVPRPGGVVRRVPSGAIALLKGDGWPEFAGRGIVHRSPPVDADTPRTLLTIDLVAA
jgi:hypothetical protein